ncbi:MAG: hypothetical protein K0R93_3188 [Anaerosolibacter sp.]|jgi:hypothetical protein|nr:hypothetical protein [Anaerosolibacter sp.]
MEKAVDKYSYPQPFDTMIADYSDLLYDKVKIL